MCDLLAVMLHMLRELHALRREVGILFWRIELV